MKPKVSICLPNLNTLPYLSERFETIFGQSFQDWELLVYDSYSDDGAWEYIQQLAVKEPRMRAWQGPREGTPGSWNPCLAEARGEYVYIATSDDTMAPDCLEKLVTALELNKDCELAHCPVICIDDSGSRLSEPDSTVFADHLGEFSGRPHIRRAPYDGFLHLTGRHVTLSITQLLIRRSLFSRTGDFPSKWGGSGDFNWEMKAGLIANMVHVPETWASWRRHGGQVTNPTHVYGVEHDRKVDDMIRDAVESCAGYLHPAVAEALRSHWVDWTCDMRRHYANLRSHQSVSRRRLYQFAQVFNGTKASRSELLGRLAGRPKWPEIAISEMRRWLESLGLGPMIIPTQGSPGGNVHREYVAPLQGNITIHQ